MRSLETGENRPVVRCPLSVLSVLNVTITVLGLNQIFLSLWFSSSKNPLKRRGDFHYKNLVSTIQFLSFLYGTSSTPPSSLVSLLNVFTDSTCGWVSSFTVYRVLAPSTLLMI